MKQKDHANKCEKTKKLTGEFLEMSFKCDSRKNLNLIEW